MGNGVAVFCFVGIRRNPSKSVGGFAGARRNPSKSVEIRRSPLGPENLQKIDIFDRPSESVEIRRNPSKSVDGKLGGRVSPSLELGGLVGIRRNPSESVEIRRSHLGPETLQKTDVL
jgi:hypothetical protein